MSARARWFTKSVAVLLLATPAATSGAQALNYPTMQIPTVSERDYTIALGGGRGTSMYGQWREKLTERMHFGVDAGLYDPSASGERTAVFGGASIGRELMRANGDVPLDFLLTGGVGVSVAGGRSGFRVPVGVSAGRRWVLEDGMAITPFVHPRISFDHCTGCSPRGSSRSDVSLNFDVGASFEFTPRIAARVSALFSGAEQFGSQDVLAVGFTWTPEGMKR
jgi:hypothetical protein